MCKIFLAVAIAGLCFGQMIEPSVSHKFPLLISHNHYVKPLSQWDNLTLRNLQAHSQQFNPVSFSPILMMQVEAESLQPKPSFWKQAGIYGLEFVAAGLGNSASTMIALLFVSLGGDMIDTPSQGVIIYIIGNMLFTSSCTWATGHILRQKGSWWKSSLSAGMGCLIGIPSALLLSKKYPEGFMNGVALGIFLITPPLGAVIGFNIK